MCPQTADQRSRRRIAVVGAGITGLAAAHQLVSRSEQIHVDIIETANEPGGIIRTELRDGFLIEHGPDAFITNRPGAVSLCEELNFSDQLLRTNEQYRRSLVIRNGNPQSVPDGFMLMAPVRPAAILTTPILSIPGRLRLLAEFVIPRASHHDDESLASFVRRRFGREALDRLVQPLVGGIYTSDPEKLSLKATMPRFQEMERTHGSVIRAALADGRTEDSRDTVSSLSSGARYSLFVAPAAGLASLVQRLVEHLQTSGRVRLRTGTAVTRLRRASPPAHWQLDTEQTGKESETRSYEGVLLSVPAYIAARILEPTEETELCDELRGIECASTAIVTSGHRLSDFKHPMNAFGLVVPAIENRKILAVSFASRKFPDRAPDGQILLRTFVGGAMQPELLDHTDEELIRIAESELSHLLGMHRSPQFAEVHRYSRAMPQYHVGHLDRVSGIETRVGSIPQLELAGSAFRGVGIPDCISSGRAAADRLAIPVD